MTGGRREQRPSPQSAPELGALIEECNAGEQHCVVGLLEVDAAGNRTFSAALPIGPDGVSGRTSR
ncbi:MAG: hypothetical protein ACYDEN_04605 [Acidimicrobiales bacterium]